MNQNTYIFRPWSNRLPMRGNDSLINDPQWDDSANQELNSYRSYNPIALMVEPLWHPNDEKDEDWLPFKSTNADENTRHFRGRHSLFNAVNAVGDDLNYQVALNVPLLDNPIVRDEIRRRSDCSVKALVDASARGEMGRAIYTYADFMFCKHLGRISNNYLITLRRFPWPAGDHINYTMGSYDNQVDPNDHFPDIGRMVTWLGTPGNDMSAILKYDINLPYKQMKASIQEAQYNGDNSGGFLGGLMNLGSGAYRQSMLNGSGGNTGLAAIQTMASPFDKNNKFSSMLSAPSDTSWAYHKDANKSYGPVDAITETHYRQGAEDGGIKFEHNITLTFDYELRSYNGINTRAAMLDLLGNILAVTFTNATYWGGAVRGTGAAQSNIFANLPIFHMKEPISFASVQDAAFDSIGQMAQSFNNGQPVNNLKDALNAMGNLLKGALTGITAGLLNKLGRPQKNALNSMLNFQPTGLWHLMIGNPKHPIMSMGNMILDNCSIEHYGPLGLDDFPTGLKVTITLKHGMPRDNMKIEQMYMNGDFRIYQPLGDRTYQVWAEATEVNESSHGTTNNVANTAESWGGSQNQQTTEEAAIFKASTSKRFLKYFGTDNKNNIVVAGKEGYLGNEKNDLKSKTSTGQTKNNGKKGNGPKK